jgi:CRP-like cAMP-binding protein
MPSRLDSLIAHLEGIGTLPPGGRERLLRITRSEDLGRGEFFLRAGERPARIGFMTSGWLRYFHTDEEGREYIRYFCHGENFVSSQSALIEGRPSEFSIQAIEPSSLLAFEYSDWLGLLDSHPGWGAIHQAVLERALVASERRERSLILDDARRRYLAFLEEYPGIEEHVRQYDIASYLGISPVSLSRIRSGKAK